MRCAFLRIFAKKVEMRTGFPFITHLVSNLSIDNVVYLKSSFGRCVPGNGINIRIDLLKIHCVSSEYYQPTGFSKKSDP